MPQAPEHFEICSVAQTMILFVSLMCPLWLSHRDYDWLSAGLVSHGTTRDAGQPHQKGGLSHWLVGWLYTYQDVSQLANFTYAAGRSGKKGKEKKAPVEKPKDCSPQERGLGLIIVSSPLVKAFCSDERLLLDVLSTLK